MTGREDDPKVVYADIIHLPHWDSPVHPRMTMQERAAQFAPYAALVGYGDMVKEEARETGSWTPPGEDEAEELERNLRRIAALCEQGIRPVCAVSWFVPDDRKDGGEIITATEKVKKVDPAAGYLVLARQKGLAGAYEEIPLDRLVRISTEEQPHEET